MSDAEYFIEQQQEAADVRQMSADSAYERNVKPLFCWIDTEPGEDIWDWQPLSTIRGIFADLHLHKQIGSDYFIASSIPPIGEADEWEDVSPTVAPSGMIKMVGQWQFGLADNAHVGTYEVLVVSRDDAERLRAEAIRQNTLAAALKQRIVAEMLESMASHITSRVQSTVFVFARLM